MVTQRFDDQSLSRNLFEFIKTIQVLFIPDWEGIAEVIYYGVIPSVTQRPHHCHQSAIYKSQSVTCENRPHPREIRCSETIPSTTQHKTFP